MRFDSAGYRSALARLGVAAAAGLPLGGCIPTVLSGVPRVVDIGPSASGDAVDVLLKEETQRFVPRPGYHSPGVTTLSARLRVLRVPVRSQQLSDGELLRESTRSDDLENHRIGAGMVFDGESKTTWRWCRLTGARACTPVAERRIEPAPPWVPLLSPDRRRLLIDCRLLDAATGSAVPTAVEPATCRQFLEAAIQGLRNQTTGARFGLRGDGWLVAWREYAPPGAQDWAWALHLPSGQRRELLGPEGPRTTVAVSDLSFDGRHWWMLVNYFNCQASKPGCQADFQVMSPDTGERRALPSEPFGGVFRPIWWDSANRRFVHIERDRGYSHLAVLSY